MFFLFHCLQFPWQINLGLREQARASDIVQLFTGFAVARENLEGLDFFFIFFCFYVIYMCVYICMYVCMYVCMM